jgi:hypothetical protein
MMTPQEQDMLNDLVQKINSTRLEEKDDSAESLLRDGLGRNPDALYMLAQTVLVQNIALEQAKQQMMSMQQAPPPPAKATSFLGSLLGHHDPQPPPQQQYQTVQYAQQQPGNYPGGNYQPAPSGQPSFLRSAATTAAGVAAGALAFQGVESLLHGGMGGGGFGGMGGGYGGDFGGGFGGAPREEVVNNYYDNSPGGGNDAIAGPDEQPQGPYDSGAQDSGAQDSSYGDDFSDGGGDFGGDDDSNFS